MNCELKLGDSSEKLKEISDNSIDLTVTSPPYDNLRTYGDSLEWNFEIFQSIASQLYRVTKDGGVVVWIVNDATINGSETGTSFKQALYFKEIGFNLHDTMIWCKNGGGAVGSAKAYNQNFEYMFILSKGIPKTTNLIRDVRNMSYGVVRPATNSRTDENTNRYRDKMMCGNEYSKRNNWWYLVTQKEECSDVHPAVFPEKLVSDHIISWSNEGDTILDPFLGSGTTGKVALNLNRNFIGIEKNEKYFEIAKQRIELRDTKYKYIPKSEEYDRVELI